MTRRDFEAIARIIGGIADDRLRRDMAEQLAVHCKSVNAAFDFDMFLSAVEAPTRAFNKATRGL